MSFKDVKNGTRQGLSDDGRRVHTKPRETKSAKRKE